jgi:hypothetical protein
MKNDQPLPLPQEPRPQRLNQTGQVPVYVPNQAGSVPIQRQQHRRDPTRPVPQQTQKAGREPTGRVQQRRGGEPTTPQRGSESTGPVVHSQRPPHGSRSPAHPAQQQQQVRRAPSGDSGYGGQSTVPVQPGMPRQQPQKSLSPHIEISHETNNKKCTIRTIHATTIHGNVNISGIKRLSDLFASESNAFIVMVDVRMGGGRGKTIFINKDHIVWVEPLDGDSKPAS